MACFHKEDEKYRFIIMFLNPKGSITPLYEDAKWYCSKDEAISKGKIFTNYDVPDCAGQVVVVIQHKKEAGTTIFRFN